MKTFKGKKSYLENKVVSLLDEKIKDLAKSQEKIVIAIPGGRSVNGIFSKLTNKNLPWDKIHIFMVDERLVPLNKKDSNYKLAYDSFISLLVKTKQIPENNLHPYHYDKPISKYETELKKYGGKFDIALLGSGEDGHVAALFPDLSIKNEEDYFITFNNSPKPPKERMSASRKLIERSQIGILLFFGDSKKEAYTMFKDDKVPVIKCPSKLLYNIKESYVFTDL